MEGAQEEIRKESLKNLVDLYELAREANKFCVFFDKTQGNVATFFHYKARLKDFYKEIMKVEAGRQ